MLPSGCSMASCECVARPSACMWSTRGLRCCLIAQVAEASTTPSPGGVKLTLTAVCDRGLSVPCGGLKMTSGFGPALHPVELSSGDDAML